MADTDWTMLTNSLSDAQVRRGVTDGWTVPNGGGSFVFGMRSVQAVTGAVGLYDSNTDFNPMSAGGRVSGAIRKFSGGGSQSYNPMLFVGLQGGGVTNMGYLLGFTSDENPAHLILMKGDPASGIITTSDYILRQSTGTYAAGTWYHFQLDMIVQPSGDVYLQVKENDLGSYTVGSPTWAAIAGMTEYRDDALGHESGLAPYIDGRGGYATYFGGVSSRAAGFDHMVVGRQL